MEVGIILVYFSLFNPNYIALEAGEVDVPLNYLSAYFRTFSSDGRHIENRLLAISQRVIIGLTRNFVG